MSWLSKVTHKLFYMGHRLAFKMMGIEIQDGLIVDHINGKPSDNRWCNLRLVTGSGNQQNQEVHRNGKSVGVSRYLTRWAARKNVNGKTRHIGVYDTEQEASDAFQEYSNRL